MKLPYAELHAFPDGDRPHSGNPAGVMLLDRFLDDADLLGIARSNNLSETAYLVKRPDEADTWDLRWFTPGQEVDFCGHATLAAAAYLLEDGHAAGDGVCFHARVGRLEVRREDGRFVMDFPEIASTPAPAARPGVAEALGVQALEVHDVRRVHGAAYEMHVIASEAELAALRPDFAALERTGVNVIVTAKGESADVVSRFFAPGAGVPEDPVTGSAHCTLAPYWAKRLGRARLGARQIGPRPGALEMEADGSGRVRLYGAAHRFLDGAIHFAAAL